MLAVRTIGTIGWTCEIRADTHPVSASAASTITKVTGALDGPGIIAARSREVSTESRSATVVLLMPGHCQGGKASGADRRGCRVRHDGASRRRREHAGARWADRRDWLRRRR